ncbi:thioredoxin-like protein [Epithele typhae]|uniref:thioredoxin-like protein n=1 Tax=Epithele typhae TaxID=378194 RepID=UPI0020083B28|nr:thioredoxin-like protein [Epithele typhae]KAH9921954.1 thioredoxin-like protein [Epithele typhae]
MQSQIVLYTREQSPFCHRVHMALEEAQAEFSSVIIDLANKPAWFLEKVNPIGKIPAMAYGHSFGSPEDPSPDSTKPAESLVLVLFVGDLFPYSGLVPTDPALRARALLFAVNFEARVLDAYKGFFGGGAPPRTLLDAFAAVQARLPPAGFAVETWSFADIMTAPLLVRMVLLLEHEMGTFAAGEGKKTLAALKEPGFARLMEYIENLKARP